MSGDRLAYHSGKGGCTASMGLGILPERGMAALRQYLQPCSRDRDHPSGGGRDGALVSSTVTVWCPKRRLSDRIRCAASGTTRGPRWQGIGQNLDLVEAGLGVEDVLGGAPGAGL